jgi:acyl carrier protein
MAAAESMTSTLRLSDVEAIISAAWREVLQIDPVRGDDNFFDVGGDSARMLQIRDLLQARLRREVSMIELFEYPTVGELANYLVAGATAPSTQPSAHTHAARRRQAFGLVADPGQDE